MVGWLPFVVCFTELLRVHMSACVIRSRDGCQDLTNSVLQLAGLLLQASAICLLSSALPLPGPIARTNQLSEAEPSFASEPSPPFGQHAPSH